MERNISETDEIIVYGSVSINLAYMYCCVIKKKRKAAACWVRYWVANRSTLSLHVALLDDLAANDPRAYSKYLRMDEPTSKYILEKGRPLITKKTSKLFSNRRKLYSSLQYSTRSQ